MAIIIGVRFREVGKIYYFDPGHMHFNIGDKVIVETSRGVELGTVVLPQREVDDESITPPLKEVKRFATNEDLEIDRQNRAKELDALKLCRVKAKEQGLEMKVISAEYTFDNSKILFYFTAEGRIDFRELVKELAAVFRTRIELRQVGVRDETKIVGGIGSCGRPLCCHSFLTKFQPVSIKMAKEQNLSLNPQKISGVCGRLMCCLKNETDTYEYLNAKMPKEGDFVELSDGQKGVVSSTSVLRQKFKILVTKNGDEKEILEYAVKDIENIIKRKKYNQMRQELSNSEKAEEGNSKEEFRSAKNMNRSHLGSDRMKTKNAFADARAKESGLSGKNAEDGGSEKGNRAKTPFKKFTKERAAESVNTDVKPDVKPEFRKKRKFFKKPSNG